ncbi:hypothetical protein JOB18_047509 [Solea senegalensis]|nr:hypothetical protein JOB18_047509 [Solea senegalensis]
MVAPSNTASTSNGKSRGACFAPSYHLAARYHRFLVLNDSHSSSFDQIQKGPKKHLHIDACLQNMMFWCVSK